MNSRQSRVIHGGQSAIAFVAQLENPPSRVTESARRLEAALRGARDAELEQLIAKQARRVPRLSLNRAKTVLIRKHLDPIVADGLELFAGLPGIKETLRLPRIKDPPTKHLEAAARVRRFAEEHEQEFINERNYSEDFLEQLDWAVQNLEAAARVERGAPRAEYTRATEHVKEAIARVRRAFDVLDTRIHEAYLDHRSTLKMWRRQSRVPRKTGRPRKRKSSVKGAPPPLSR